MNRETFGEFKSLSVVTSTISVTVTATSMTNKLDEGA